MGSPACPWPRWRAVSPGWHGTRCPSVEIIQPLAIFAKATERTHSAPVARCSLANERSRRRGDVASGKKGLLTSGPDLVYDGGAGCFPSKRGRHIATFPMCGPSTFTSSCLKHRAMLHTGCLIAGIAFLLPWPCGEVHRRAPCAIHRGRTWVLSTSGFSHHVNQCNPQS